MSKDDDEDVGIMTYAIADILDKSTREQKEREAKAASTVSRTSPSVGGDLSPEEGLAGAVLAGIVGVGIIFYVYAGPILTTLSAIGSIAAGIFVYNILPDYPGNKTSAELIAAQQNMERLIAAKQNLSRFDVRDLAEEENSKKGKWIVQSLRICGSLATSMLVMLTSYKYVPPVNRFINGPVHEFASYLVSDIKVVNNDEPKPLSKEDLSKPFSEEQNQANSLQQDPPIAKPNTVQEPKPVVSDEDQKRKIQQDEFIRKRYAPSDKKFPPITDNTKTAMITRGLMGIQARLGDTEFTTNLWAKTIVEIRNRLKGGNVEVQIPVAGPHSKKFVCIINKSDLAPAENDSTYKSPTEEEQQKPKPQLRRKQRRSNYIPQIADRNRMLAMMHRGANTGVPCQRT